MKREIGRMSGLLGIALCAELSLAAFMGASSMDDTPAYCPPQKERYQCELAAMESQAQDTLKFNLMGIGAFACSVMITASMVRPFERQRIPSEHETYDRLYPVALTQDERYASMIIEDISGLPEDPDA